MGAAELSPADRAALTPRRKQIYLLLHPETAHHVAGAIASNAAQGNDTSDKLAVASFAVATAQATGKDRRTVERDDERGRKICAQALDLVRGTELDKGSYLDKLKKIENPDEQVEAVQRALAGFRCRGSRERRTAVL